MTSKLLCGLVTALLAGCGGGGDSPYVPPVILPVVTKTIVTIMPDHHMVVLGSNSAHDITGFFLDGTHMSLGTGQTVCAESDKNGWTSPPNSTSKKCAPVVNGTAEITGTPASDCVTWTLHSGTSFWWADIGLNENKDNALSIVGGTAVQVGTQKCVRY